MNRIRINRKTRFLKFFRNISSYQLHEISLSRRIANSSKNSEESFKVAMKKRTRLFLLWQWKLGLWKMIDYKTNPDFPLLFLPVTHELTPLRTLSRVTVVTYCPFLEEIRRVHCFIARWRNEERKREREIGDEAIVKRLSQESDVCHGRRSRWRSNSAARLETRSWRLDGLFWLHDRPRIIASADHAWLVIFERRSLCCRARGSKKLNWKD